MTVCVAAIANGGSEIIVAADNMVTLVVGQSIQYQKEDNNHKKIWNILPGIYALFSGALHIQEPLLRLSLGKIRPNSSPFEVATILRSSLQEFYLQKCEEEILLRLNLTWKAFIEKQQQLSPEFVRDLLQKINGFILDIQVIIAGFDSNSGQPFLGLVVGNGILFEKTLEGWLTSGGGGELAKFSLILHDYTISLSAEKAESLVRQAVSDAKRSPGVGDLGEVIIIPKPTSQTVPEPPKPV